MLILDTDHVSILEWEHGEEYAQLKRRLDRLHAADLATTIVSYEEQTRGWLAYLAKARKLSQQIEAYRRLHRHLDVYRSIRVLDFDDRAAVEFQNLQHVRRGIGTTDTRIAAIAISRQATLLTRNTVDFERVPGLRFADWTLPEP